ncbi:hypothetical protein C8R45DRAFT_1109893 [Mycena sanguinolenta]|nr:hypothetical protein C8R45DRAFT_1109893 [Mycena sanguinolenta]
MPYTHSEDDRHPFKEDNGWEDVPIGTGIHTFPPGEEAVLQSHAGGEAIMHQLMEGMRPGVMYYVLTVPCKASLAKQLTTAYDAYLTILHQVDLRVHQALGHDEMWDWKNACPPCFHVLKDELPLKLSWLGSIDGNNSLKLVDSTFRAGNPRFDNRQSPSFRWLTPQEVDKYMDEVKNSPKVSMTTAASMAAVAESLSSTSTPTTLHAAAASVEPSDAAAFPPPQSHTDFPDSPADFPVDSSGDDGDVAWLNVNELNPNDAGKVQKCVNTCVERWKAAGPEAYKKMFTLFAIAGSFISVCRHGHVLVIMKYPLAIVSKLFERYGSDPGIGYDIMCAFFKTLLRSSLGRKTVGLRMRGIFPAFHGHAHNRMCQIGCHPICTRLSTPFYRQQQIDEHFYFHDLDKHAASGNFIFQNYRQAMEKITANRLKLQILEDTLHTTGADYEQDLKDDDASDVAVRDYKNLDALIIRDGYTRPQIVKVKARYQTAFNHLVLVTEEVTRFEEEHGIAPRWTTGSKEYNDALLLTNEQRYHRALDKLERLVVQTHNAEVTIP